MSEQSQIDQLNTKFAIGDALQFKPHESGLVVGQVACELCDAQFFLHGAHVTSFHPKGHGQPLLFMSDKSVFDDRKAIRGGIPICFPWFSSHPTDKDAPAHGFARIQNWEMVRAFDEEDGAIVVELRTSVDPFELVYRIQFADDLSVRLTVQNTGNEHAQFEVALHSYFVISDTKNVRITGLEQARFVDQLKENQEFDPSSEPIVFEREFDRIYIDTDATVSIHDSEYDRVIEIEKLNSHSTVVWNPWAEKSQRMADFGDAEYHRMCCVETANIRQNAILLQPDEKHTTGCIHRIL